MEHCFGKLKPVLTNAPDPVPSPWGLTFETTHTSILLARTCTGYLPSTIPFRAVICGCTSQTAPGEPLHDLGSPCGLRGSSAEHGRRPAAFALGAARGHGERTTDLTQLGIAQGSNVALQVPSFHRLDVI